jgi:hypothetical protein
MAEEGLRTNFYIDGFNLYYRLLEPNPALKWLDLDRWCRLLMPKVVVHRIRYFTALVDARPNDPDQPNRQQIYWRALATLPSVTIHLGRFKTRTKRVWLAHPPPNTTLARISEEKGSDVNLATLLVADAFREDFDQAVVISDDSDLMLPIEIVVNELGRPVGVLNPQQKPLDPKHPRASELQAVASFYRVLRLGPIQGSQFPDELTDAVGTFNRPPSWSAAAPGP